MIFFLAPDGHGLQEVLSANSPKQLDRIFSFLIFLSLLSPLCLPIPSDALLLAKKLLPTPKVLCLATSEKVSTSIQFCKLLQMSKFVLHVLNRFGIVVIGVGK